MSSRAFEGFLQVHRTYSVVDGHDLQLTVFVPQNITPNSKCTILVHFHGGAFIVGHRLYEEWYAKWMMQLALSKNAIVVSPDFRLVPEAKATEILQDIRNFWQWLSLELPHAAQSWTEAPRIHVDLESVAVHGESSGGWLAMQSSFLFNSTHLKPKCIITTCASLDFNLPHFNIPRPRSILGRPPLPTREAEMLIRKHIRGIMPGSIRTATDPAELWSLMTAVVQQGCFKRLLGQIDPKEGNLDLLQALEERSKLLDLDIPPCWVVVGIDDSMTHPESSTNFVDKLQVLMPQVPVKLTMVPGDHGFDFKETLNTEWVKEGCEFVGKYWP